MKIPRFLIGAVHSGSGKTMITCGLLYLLKKRGLSLTSYKCGPDYIDPMFHRTVIGITGGNLDTFFSSAQDVRRILSMTATDMAVMEGVMGLYDGIGGTDIKGSSYEVAAITGTPVILVVDGYGSGRTMISVVKGILADDKEKLIKGIIFNKVSSGFYERIAPVIHQEITAAGYEVQLLGAIPRVNDIIIDSRHLGLMMPQEIPDVIDNVSRMARVIEDNCDVEGIMAIADMAGNTDCFVDEMKSQEDVRHFNIGVARDEAFCFYYNENLEYLKKTGACIKEFSPIHDEKLPENIDGLLLGGGYPENYLKELSANLTMLNDIQKFAQSGRFIIAECGGFMYLHDYIEDKEGRRYDMAGIVKAGCHYTGKLVRFGYITLEGEDPLCGMRGHEFHYYDSDDNGDDFEILKAGADVNWKGMHVSDKMLLGFPHLYYDSNPDGIRKFIYNNLSMIKGK